MPMLCQPPDKVTSEQANSAPVFRQFYTNRSHMILHKNSCLCLRAVHCYETHGQLCYISPAVRQACGLKICHCAVTADWYFYEKSNIRPFIALNKPSEADTAKTDPAIFTTLSSQWIFVGLISVMCVCMPRGNCNPRAWLDDYLKICQQIKESFYDADIIFSVSLCSLFSYLFVLSSNSPNLLSYTFSHTFTFYLISHSFHQSFLLPSYLLLYSVISLYSLMFDFLSQCSVCKNVCITDRW